MIVHCYCNSLVSLCIIAIVHCCLSHFIVAIILLLLLLCIIIVYIVHYYCSALSIVHNGLSLFTVVTSVVIVNCYFVLLFIVFGMYWVMSLFICYIVKPTIVIVHSHWDHCSLLCQQLIWHCRQYWDSRILFLLVVYYARFPTVVQSLQGHTHAHAHRL